LWTSLSYQQLNAPLNVPQPLEVIITARATTSNPTDASDLFEGGYSNNVLQQYANSNTIQMYQYGYGPSVGITPNQDFVVDGSFNGANTQLSINGGPAQTGNFGSSASGGGLTIGNYGAASSVGHSWGGYIYEVAMYNRALSPSERGQVLQGMGQVLPVVSGYKMPPTSPTVGQVPASTVISLAVGLPLQNLAGLQALVDASADPTSPTYRQHISQTTLMQNYAPSATDYGKLAAWGRSYGLNVVTYGNNIVADITGTAGQIEQALFVNLVYQTRPDGSTFYGPDRPPRIALPVTLLGMSGLDNFVLPRPGQTAPIAGTFQSNDLRAAYLGPAGSPCAGVTGQGQSIGLFELDGFTPADVITYQNNTALMGVPAVQVQTTNVRVSLIVIAHSAPS
jgi:hypothetical protein